MRKGIAIRIGLLALVIVGTVLTAKEARSFGAPGDVNNPFWKWQNQGSAVASWTNGALQIDIGTDAGSGSGDFRMLYQLVPSAPYTFEIFVDSNARTNYNECGIGLYESATGKFVTFTTIANAGTPNSQPGLDYTAWSNSTTHSDIDLTSSMGNIGGGGYLKIQVTSGSPGNIVTSWSGVGDGVSFKQYKSEAVTAHFTTAPDRVIIGGVALSTTAGPVCNFDFFRRTQ